VTDGLDLKGWNRIAGILDDLASDWPGVATELGWITTRHSLWEDNPRGTVAAAESVSGEKLAFNPYYFASPMRIAKAASHGEQTGWYPRSAGEAREWYFVSHEWGHLVDAWLRRRDPERWRRLAAVFAIDPGDRPFSFDPEKGGAVSLYARRGFSDAFADAFSVIQWRSKSHWPAIIRQFARILGSEP
jgi:hypothetical protein